MGEDIRLHLGCGDVNLEGFLHIDLGPYSHVDYRTSVDVLDMFQDNTVSLIYAAHVLEHFSRHDIERVLTEWYRVLKKGGILRLAVPDFRACVDRYLENGGDLTEILGLLIGGHKDEYDRHGMIFDERLLSDYLQRAGFSKWYRYDWRKVDYAHIDDFSQAYLPHMEKGHGRLMSLNVEAIK
ncbi:hypothetical protein ES705_09256 [subsurface metagenome]